MKTSSTVCPECRNNRIVRDPFGPGLVPCPACNAPTRLSRLYCERARLWAERDRLDEQLHAIECAIPDAISDRDAAEFFDDLAAEDGDYAEADIRESA